MATRRPLAVVSGAVSEVPSGDTVDPAALPTFVASISNDEGSITIDSLGSGAFNVKVAAVIFSNLTSLLAGKQDIDADLTDIAGLSATDGDFLRRVSGHWANITTAALKTALALAKADVGLGNVDNTSNATERAAAATLTNKTLTSPAITTPTGIVKGDVGLGNVDNTSNVTERAASATLTNKTLTSPVINTPTGIVASDVGAQPVDSDLTAFAAISPSNDDIVQRKAGAWINRTVAQLATDLALAATYQPLDADLTDLAGLTYTDGDFVRRVSGHFATITTAALKTALSLTATDVGLGNVNNTSNVTERAAAATLTNKTLTSPVISTPTGIVKGDVGLGNVDNTSNTTERAAAATLTNKTLTSPVINTPTGITASDVGAQPVDSDLTAFAALTPTNDDVVQRKAGAWVNRTIAQLLTDLGLAALYQPLASKLTDIAALTATSGNIVTGNGTTWTSAAPAVPAWSTKVETIADSSSLTGDSLSGAIQVGVCTALTQAATVNPPSNGYVGAVYRYIITASGGARVVTPSGFAASTDNGSGAAVSVPSGKTISIFSQYIGSSGWLYGGYELLV